MSLWDRQRDYDQGGWVEKKEDGEVYSNRRQRQGTILACLKIL